MQLTKWSGVGSNSRFFMKIEVRGVERKQQTCEHNISIDDKLQRT